MRLKDSAAAVAIALVAVPLPASSPDCKNQPEIVTELGKRAQVPMVFAPIGDGVEEYPSPAHAGARYLRILVQATQVPDCQWYFNVRDAMYRLVQVLDRTDFAGHDTSWTRRIAGEFVVFDLQPCADGRKPTLKFLEYIWMPKEAARPYYSIQGQQPAYIPITNADTWRKRLGDFVGFLVSSWERQSWVCSGVMLTRDLFLTNWHCGGPPGFKPEWHWQQPMVRDTLIDLSFDGDDLSRELKVTALAAMDENLDYAILRTQPLDNLGPIRAIKISTAPLTSNQRLNIVHHPGGNAKQLSTNCVVSKPSVAGWRATADNTEFKHVCDTEGGSSGAPVLDESGALVGLHHLGFDYDPKTCKYTDHENKAIKLTAILEHLRTTKDKAKNDLYKAIVSK